MVLLVDVSVSGMKRQETHKGHKSFGGNKRIVGRRGEVGD